MNIKYEEKESAPRKPTISLEEHSQTARKCQSLNNLKYICITCRHFTGFPPFKKQPAGTQNLIKQSCRLCYDSNRRLSFWGGFFTVEGGKLEQRDGLGETILCHAMHCLEGNRLFLPSSLVGWLTFYSFLFFSMFVSLYIASSSSFCHWGWLSTIIRSIDRVCESDYIQTAAE